LQITELEKDKQKQQEMIRTLLVETKEKDTLIDTLQSTETTTTTMEEQNIEKSTSSMEFDTAPVKDDTFNQFLELRKKLRRCIFKNTAEVRTLNSSVYPFLIIIIIIIINIKVSKN
jgi:hypothetical protein